MEEFICQMKDGSEFRMPVPPWNEALTTKYPVDSWPEVKEAFATEVQQHWVKKTVPTKFAFDEAWEKEYKDQAELGYDVMYQYIRVPLMAIALRDMGSKCKVIGLRGDGLVNEYDGKGKRTKTVKESFGE